MWSQGIHLVTPAIARLASNPEREQIVAAEFTVDGQIDSARLRAARKLKANTD
jgi:hypothetical protein